MTKRQSVVRRAKSDGFPKGRVLHPDETTRLKQLIGEQPYRRDLLLEYLHCIQDSEGCLPCGLLHALADAMKLAQVEVFEVASFFDHFDIVRDGGRKPAPITIRVCDSLSCMLAGSEALIHELETNVDPARIRIVRAPCMGGCDRAPAARIGRREVAPASASELISLGNSATSDRDFSPIKPACTALQDYQDQGGYQTLSGIRKNKMPFERVLETLEHAGLRGMGGAGFPVHSKWKIVKSFRGPRLMTVNIDEGEPGTFKDRCYLERDPHRMIEGALIGAHFVEADRIYLFVRDEYPAVLEILRTEVSALEASGIVPAGFLEIRRSAGAYICGEESAMMEAIEGKRPLPRHRPPYVAESGLFGRPTLNHNAETLWWIRDILEKGSEWFASQGTEGHPGPRSWSVSGRVACPGVVLAPAGVSVRALIGDYCGGMAEGHTFKAYLPGGASGGVLPASMGDIPLDFGGPLDTLSAFVGSHAIVVLSDRDNIREIVANTMRFFEHESCGQCTPCRCGTAQLAAILSGPGSLNVSCIRDIESVMRDASICGLGQAAPNPVSHLLSFFPEDL